MTDDDIENILVLMGQARAKEFEFRQDGYKVKAKFGSHAPTTNKPFAAIEKANTPIYVTAPRMGFLRLTHPNQEQQFISIGDLVKKGQKLAFVQYGDLLEGVVSMHEGIVNRIISEEGDVVGFNDPVFELKLPS